MPAGATMGPLTAVMGKCSSAFRDAMATSLGFSRGLSFLISNLAFGTVTSLGGFDRSIRAQCSS